MSRKDKKIRLLLTGGGTGGHLFPAVATAQEFQKQMPDTEVLFVGTKRKVDTKSLGAYGFASESILCYGLKGKNPLELLKAIAVLPVSYLQALMIIRRFKPDIIFGVGGYVTGPVVAAGKNLGIPVVIHEQNSVPGLANRKLGRLPTGCVCRCRGAEQNFRRIKYFILEIRYEARFLSWPGNRSLEKIDKRTLLDSWGKPGGTGCKQFGHRGVMFFN